jgi:hypothetical protein
VNGMFAAELAILVHLKAIRIVFFVLDRIVIPLLAFSAGHRDLNSHYLQPRLSFLLLKKIIIPDNPKTVPKKNAQIGYHESPGLSIGF